MCGDGPHRHIPHREDGDAGWYYYAQKPDLRFRPVAELNRSADQGHHLFRVVERCCRFHLHDRYASVEELLAELDGRRDGSPAPVADPLDRAVGCFNAHDPRGCLAALDAVPGPGDRAGALARLAAVLGRDRRAEGVAGPAPEPAVRRRWWEAAAHRSAGRWEYWHHLALVYHRHAQEAAAARAEAASRPTGRTRRSSRPTGRGPTGAGRRRSGRGWRRPSAGTRVAPWGGVNPAATTPQKVGLHWCLNLRSKPAGGPSGTSRRMLAALEAAINGTG